MTRTFVEDEDGSYCFAHDDLVGEKGIVKAINPSSLGINMNYEYYKAVPYFALEVIKEPTYRPFRENELNYLVGEVLTNKYTGNNKLVTERLGPCAVRIGDTGCTAKDLLERYTLDGHPCGVKEEV